MFEHERSLVKKYKNRPFVLMGVNTDEKKDLPRIIKENKLTWNSWADGPATNHGPIMYQYKVDGFPTLFLVDGNGKIRAKILRESQLDETIEALVQETEKNNKALLPAP